MTPFERFTLDGIDAIRSELEKVSEFALQHKHENNRLISIIDSLARAAAMFADVKAQELSGKVKIVDPQGYIQAKLESVRESMTLFQEAGSGDFKDENDPKNG